MRHALPAMLVGLPFVTAVALLLVGSRRVAGLLQLGAGGVLVVMACALAWQARDAVAWLVLLTTFVAQSTAWFSDRDDAVQSLDRRDLRRCQVGCQVLIGGLLLAMLADDMMVSWLALVAALAAVLLSGPPGGSTAAGSRLLLLCGSGLMLALLGTLLLEREPGPAGLLLLLGYGALAGLPPLHGWLADIGAEGTAPDAVLVTTLLPNVPLLLFMRAGVAVEPLMVMGLVALLLGAAALFVHSDARRSVAFAGMAQLGMIVFAIGIGATSAAWLHMTLLTLTRAAALQSRGADIAAWLALALLPLYALGLIAGPTVALSAWLLPPLAGGAMLTVWALLGRRPAALGTAPVVWLQVAVAVVLALATPAPLVAWFRAAATG